VCNDLQARQADAAGDGTVLRGRRRNNAALSVTRGLVIDQPWVGLIADRKKTWEMRTRPTKVRGWIGLIEKGTGTVIGIACLMGSRPSLKRKGHHLYFEKHRVPPMSNRKTYDGKYLTPWVLAKAFRLPKALPYQHPSGAVTWVTFADKVSRSLSRRLRAKHAEERT
jgi:hypothetical protein